MTQTRAASVQSLPPPPAGKQGWPWTEGSPATTTLRRNGLPWPRISIVTPSFRQGKYIEETIRSVLLQGYPNLEYLVMDGGSQDGTVDIIKKYEPWLTRWASEKDAGQSHAINKGFALATGAIRAWLNSDDVYPRQSLQFVGEHFDVLGPILIGKCLNYDADSRPIGEVSPTWTGALEDPRLFTSGVVRWFGVNQPSAFWSRIVHERVGPLNERLHYVMDLDFLLRALSLGFKPQTTEQPLSIFRRHAEAKTSAFEPLFALDKAKMFMNFSGQPGFRRLVCWKSAVVHYSLYHRNTGLAAARAAKPLKALAHLLAGVAVFPSPYNLLRTFRLARASRCRPAAIPTAHAGVDSLMD